MFSFSFAHAVALHFQPVFPGFFLVFGYTPVNFPMETGSLSFQASHCLSLSGFLASYLLRFSFHTYSQFRPSFCLSLIVLFELFICSRFSCHIQLRPSFCLSLSIYAIHLLHFFLSYTRRIWLCIGRVLSLYITHHLITFSFHACIQLIWLCIGAVALLCLLLSLAIVIVSSVLPAAGLLCLILSFAICCGGSGAYACFHVFVRVVLCCLVVFIFARFPPHSFIHNPGPRHLV